MNVVYVNILKLNKAGSTESLNFMRRMLLPPCAALFELSITAVARADLSTAALPNKFTIKLNLILRTL